FLMGQKVDVLKPICSASFAACELRRPVFSSKDENRVFRYVLEPVFQLTQRDVYRALCGFLFEFLGIANIDDEHVGFASILLLSSSEGISLAPTARPVFSSTATFP